MNAVVLAAGFGTRLGERTKTLPKPLLPVGRTTIIEFILGRLKKAGFETVGVNLHHHAEMIQRHLGDGTRYGLRIVYSLEPALLGTAGGALRLAQVMGMTSGPLLVHYGDVLTDHDLGGLWRLHLERKPSATLLLHRRKGSNSYVEMDDSGQITRFEERPALTREIEHWVHSGVSVIDCALLHGQGDGSVDLPRDVYPAALQNGRMMIGQPLNGWRCAVDSPKRLAEADVMVKDSEQARF